ncbi:MAG: hypothetical protein WBG64_15165, partial [Thermoanaerobaculia bacterium]
GLVGGEGLLGVLIAAVAFVRGRAPEGFGYEWAGALAPWLALGVMALLAWHFWRLTTRAEGER